MHGTSEILTQACRNARLKYMIKLPIIGFQGSDNMILDTTWCAYKNNK